MAFQAPNTGQERQSQNRKILEQLEEQKKRLRQQTQAAPGAATSTATTAGVTATTTTTVGSNPSIPAAPIGFGGPDIQHMTQAQRAALQHAHANSVGYFITQDSSFGNLILPVLPRLEKTT